ncbi:hypothetical protein A0H81_10977 [Grifola frondosa]|uniref:Asparaginase n=1 Tax=Grifola frondosa TaxID=5627 RepID=A0A1C7LYS9_GRIFR|nr:hypothetical protein A0H81_10977 [Grifola frondosa]
MDVSQTSDESRVLILNTGGTINMIFSQQGYVPEPFFLMETLHSQQRFHDPFEESLYSHSASVEGYRLWNNHSGKASPLSSSSGSRETSPSPMSRLYPVHTLPVRSSRPIGVPAHLAPITQQVLNKHPPCIQISDDVYEAQLPSLITPRSSAPGENRKRIRYAILEWHPLMDSSNIEIQAQIGFA